MTNISPSSGQAPMRRKNAISWGASSTREYATTVIREESTGFCSCQLCIHGTPRRQAILCLGVTYRKVVEVGQDEEDTDDGQTAQEHRAHWRLPASLLVHLAPTVTPKGRHAHEASADQVGRAQRHELPVGTELYPRHVFAGAKALGGDGGLEKPKQGDEKRGAHGVPDMCHMRQLERPPEGEDVA